MNPNIRNWRLAALLAIVCLATTPALAQVCSNTDSGLPRPQFMQDRLPECGGTVPIPGPQLGGGALTTLFAANNQGAATGGVYFDLEAVGGEDVDVTSWDTSLEATFTGDVSVWYRPGTFAGFETSPAGWVLIGTAVGVASAGTDVPTPLNVGATHTIVAGDINGIALSLTPTAGAAGHTYTNGTGGNQVYNDGVLELRAGSANNVAFSPGVFSPRVWNGTVYYDTGPQITVLDIPTLNVVGLFALLVGLGGAGLAVIRRRRTA